MDTDTILGYNVLCPWQLAIIKLVNQLNLIIGFDKYVISGFYYTPTQPNHLTAVDIFMRAGPTVPLERLIPTIDTITCEQLSFYLTGTIVALKDNLILDKK